MSVVSVSKERVEVTYFRGSDNFLEFFSHIEGELNWRNWGYWGKVTTFGGQKISLLIGLWTLCQIRQKIGELLGLPFFFWQCQDFKSAIHPLFPNRHSSFLSWIRLKQMISFMSSPWGVSFFWHSCGNTFKSWDIGREEMLCNFFTQEQQTE